MTSIQRLVLNTLVAYARSVFGAALALFGSRWVLNALGQIDFGIFTLVGSLIISITFLNNIMSSSVGRHYAFAVGEGNTAEVNRWFNAALSIHLFLATALIIMGWPVGEYVIAHTLNIPAERIITCVWVFRISLVSAFVNMISIPFVAMFVAKQHIAELSVWGILQSIMTFTLAYMLTSVSGDRLLFYSFGMVIILVFIQTVQIVRAVSGFRECSIVYNQWFDITRLRKILSFASWNLFGGLGVTFRNQGSTILLNLFYGANVNAAFGIANQVSSQTNQLATAMIGAFTPEITSSEGRGDRERMLSLALRSSKFGAILVMLFAVPLMVEMDYVLVLWLRVPPDYTAMFCQLILCTFLIDRMTAGYMLAVNAYGRIAAYQATVGTCLLFTLPLAWIFLKVGYAPHSVGVAFIITMTACSIGRIYWVRRLFDIPVSRWLLNVLLPCFIVAIAATLASVVPRLFLSSSFLRLALTTVASVTTTLLVAWFFAFDTIEREIVNKITQGIFSRFKGKFSFQT
ncbi:hypothetical protein DSLASN_12190 [Desulfoluna limicola]|uniref:Polysaccharide biosynthesis protein n=1 Tax=Desulfoluna limicola TaxID=2810562 RepID=A0ABM7PEJ4_9BACT|nr:hypothetical protein [Desulfoluna limicola]BCS95587.1 hypothetical protein DSLASN_12190 [Desulfoluna limicola]